MLLLCHARMLCHAIALPCTVWLTGWLTGRWLSDQSEKEKYEELVAEALEQWQEKQQECQVFHQLSNQHLCFKTFRYSLPQTPLTPLTPKCLAITANYVVHNSRLVFIPAELHSLLK